MHQIEDFLEIHLKMTATNGPGEPSVSLLGNSTDDLIMSGRGAGAPHISFSLSQNAGLSWKETTVLTAIDSPGCQSPVTGTYDGTSFCYPNPAMYTIPGGSIL